jgi:hypothetical protein
MPLPVPSIYRQNSLEIFTRVDAFAIPEHLPCSEMFG